MQRKSEITLAQFLEEFESKSKVAETSTQHFRIQVIWKILCVCPIPITTSFVFAFDPSTPCAGAGGTVNENFKKGVSKFGKQKTGVFRGYGMSK